MQASRLSVLATGSFILSVLSVGCSEGGKVATSEQTRKNTGDVDAFILALPHFEVAEAMPKTEIDCDGLCPQPEQDGDSYCT